MFYIVRVSLLEKSIQSLLLVGVILLVRRYFNVRSIKRANMILWTILFTYLLIPYSILINLENLAANSVFETILKPVILINGYSKLIIVGLGSILSTINRTCVTTLILVYTAYQFYEMHKGLKGSKIVEKDGRIEDYIGLFNFKREIKVLVNDNVKVPITYGVINPKIIIQSHILQDDELLKFVIIHELTHIKGFDMVFTHIKNLIACVYWYNIFILVASRYVEDDIEVLCDKRVIQRIGDTSKNRRDYCLSMLKLLEVNEKNTKFTLKLNPTKERMIIMKKWRQSLAGVMSFVMLALMSTTVFADIKNRIDNQVVSSEKPSTIIETVSSDRVEVISDSEYAALELGETMPLYGLRSVDIEESETLDGLSNKKYSFDMSSFTNTNHKGFAVKLSDIKCKSEPDYEIIIQENEDIVYRDSFKKETNLKIKAQNNSKYKVVIHNNSIDTLKYKIKINSYL